jgi:hypothetical protein
MTTSEGKRPFKAEDYFMAEATEVDFGALEDAHVFALVAAYGRYNARLAARALGELVRRADTNPALKDRTLYVLAQIVAKNQVDEAVFADALEHLYELDRELGQAEIVRVIDTCAEGAVTRAASALHVDLERRHGDRAFDEAVAKVAERLRKECQAGHVLTDEELLFLTAAPR